MKLFIFAGEPSGDLLGASLIEALKRLSPEASLIGVGGPAMRSAGLTPFMNTEEFSIMGFVEVAAAFPKLYQQFYRVRDKILEENPEVVVLIDYPGMNLRLARSLKKKGYAGKIVQYVSPTVWAWGKNRKKVMAEYLDLLLVIYPFEIDCFRGFPLPVAYVGNPVLERLSKHSYRKNHFPDGPLIAIFPGSRLKVVHNNFGRQLEAARIMKNHHPELLFAVSCANDQVKNAVLAIANNSALTIGKDLFIVAENDRYELMRDCQMAIATSGTVTLELALHLKPTVVTYEVSSINRFIGKHLLRITLSRFCIVNILMGRDVFPELIEHNVPAAQVADAALQLYQNEQQRARCIADCRELYALLGDHDSSARAAQLILEAHAPLMEMVKT